MSLRVDWIPSAIVIIGSLMGLGAFAGSGRVATPEASMAAPDPAGLACPSPEHSESESAPEPRSTPVTSAPALLETSRGRTAEGVRPGRSSLGEQVTASSRAAIEAMRPELIRQCWEPSASRNPEPERIHVGYSLAFRRDGTVAASGILVDQDNARPDISGCLTKLVHGLRIPPPGRSISIEVRIQLP